MNMGKSAVIPFPVQAPSTKASQAMPLFSMSRIGQPQWSPRNIEAFTKEGYAKNWVLFTCVNEIASCAAAIPLRVWSISKEDFIPDHPVAQLLRSPNPFATRTEFFKAVYAYMKITGNSYLEWSTLKELGEGNVPEELYVLPPKYMKVIPGKYFIQGYLFEYEGKKRMYEYDIIKHTCRIMHWKNFNPLDTWYGMSCVQAAAMAVDTHNKAGDWNKALLDNGARPSGALVYSPKGEDTSDTLTDEQYLQLKQRMEDQWSGTSNRGRPILLEGGLFWEQMSLDPTEMDFLQSRNTDAIGIANTVGYPPFLLGLDTGQATYNNVAEAKLSLYQETILPMVDEFKERLTQWLRPYFGDDFEIDYDKDEIEALQPQRNNIWDRVSTASWLTVNEKRAACKYPPVNQGDVILVPSLNMPLKDVVGSSTGVNGSNEDAGKGTDVALELKVNFKDADSSERNKQTRLINQNAKTFEKRFRSLLEDHAAKIGSAYSSKGKRAAENEAKKTSVYTPTLKQLYSSVMPVAGKRLLDAVKNSVSDYDVKIDEDPFDLFEDDVASWIQKHAAEKSKLIAGVTADKLRAILVDAVGEGIGTVALGKRIADQLTSLSRGRANTIARTEVHQSFNTASNMAAERSGVKLKKKWLSTPDKRTRESHKRVHRDNGLKGLKETFTVGGSELRFPGDPEGEAGEVINCRCTIRHIPQ